MRAHACIIIIICTRTCFTHNAAYIVAIGLHRATTSYPSRDFSAARNIFCLNLKRTAFGNVKTTLGLVLAALQVILVPSTNVGRIAHSLIHEPFKERLLLTRLREKKTHSKNRSVGGHSTNHDQGQHPPSRVRKLSEPKRIDRALDRARRRPRRRPSPPRARAHIATAIVVTLLPLHARCDATARRERSSISNALDRASSIATLAHGIVVVVVVLLHRHPPSVRLPSVVVIAPFACSSS